MIETIDVDERPSCDTCGKAALWLDDRSGWDYQDPRPTPLCDECWCRDGVNGWGARKLRESGPRHQVPPRGLNGFRPATEGVTKCASGKYCVDAKEVLDPDGWRTYGVAIGNVGFGSRDMEGVWCAGCAEEANRWLVGVVHRAAGSSSVYFGPFAGISAVAKWVEHSQVGVGVIELVDPDSDQNTWWNR